MRSIIPFGFLVAIFCLSCSDSQTYFLETFDSKGAWVLSVSGNDPGNGDTASTSISNGVLELNADQEFGCPKADAEFDFADLDTELNGVSNFVIEVVVQRANTTAMGQDRIEVQLKDTLVWFYVDTFAQDVTTPTTIRISWGSNITVTQDGSKVSRTVESNSNAPHIKFESAACAADAYAGATMTIDSISVTS